MRTRYVSLATYGRTLRYQVTPMSGPSLLGNANCAADRLEMTKWRSTRTRSARWSLSLAEWRPTIISSLTSIPAFRDSSPRPSRRSSDTMRYIAIISLFSARLRASTSARSSTSRGASADMYTAVRKACAAIPSQGYRCTRISSSCHDTCPSAAPAAASSTNKSSSSGNCSSATRQKRVSVSNAKA